MTVEAIHVFNAYIFECCNDSNYIDIYIDIIHIYIVFFHPVHGPHCDSLRPWVLASDHFKLWESQKKGLSYFKPII